MKINYFLLIISTIFFSNSSGQIDQIKHKNNLIQAVKSNDLELFSKLLSEKSDVHQIDDQGKSALAYAVSNSNEFMVRCLIQSGADINVRDKINKTPLMYAVSKSGNLKIVELLLQAGANPYGIDIHNNSVLMYAVLYSDLQIVDLLLKKNHNINTVNSTGYNVLNLAITNNADYKVIKALIKYGCDTESKSIIGGYTSLMHAVYCGRDDVVTELLLNGADHNAIDINGLTAQQIAVAFGRTKCVNAFRKAKIYKYLRIAKYCGATSLLIMLGLYISTSK